MALREIAATFGIEFDAAPLVEGDAAIEATTESLVELDAATDVAAASLDTAAEAVAEVGDAAAEAAPEIEEVAAAAEEAGEAAEAFGETAADSFGDAAKAADKTADAVAGAGDSADSTTSTMVDLGKAVLAAFAVDAIAGFVVDLAAIGDEAAKTSRILGVTTDELQRLQFVAASGGVETQDLQGAMIGLQNQMLAAADGSADMRNRFRALGVEIQDGEGNLRSVGDVLPELADGLQGLESDTERAAIASVLMGDAGARLVPALAGGSEGIAAMADEFDRLGGGLSAEAVSLAESFTQALGSQDVALTSLKSRFIEEFFPVLEELVGVLSDVTVWFATTEEGMLTLEAAAAALATLLAVAVVPRILSAVSATLAWASANAALIVPVLALAAAAALAFLVIDDILVTLDGGDSVLSRAAEGIEEITGFLSEQGGVLEIVGDFWQEMIASAERFIELVAESDGITDFFSRIGGFLGGGEDTVAGAPPTSVARRGDAGARTLSAEDLRGLQLDVGEAIDVRTGAALTGEAASLAVTNNNNVTINGSELSPADLERAVSRGIERANAEALDDLEPEVAT
jgi:hypothetical protein